MTGENFETCDQRSDIWPVSIYVGDLLISGGEVFGDYITQRMRGNSEPDIYLENEATYLGDGDI